MKFQITYPSAQEWALSNPTLRFGTMELGPGAINSYGNFKPYVNNTTGRVYVQPKGDPGKTTRAAIKVFFDDYDATVIAGKTDYRDFGIFTSTDDLYKGPNGAGTAFINSKTNGNFFGFVPQIALSRSDGNEIPFRAVTINSLVTEAATNAFVATFQGEWTSGKTYAIGDTVCASTGKAYQATSAGIAGATIPSHLSGTVSDGAVNWLFLWDNGAVSGTGIKMFAVSGKGSDALRWDDVLLAGAGHHFTRDIAIYGGMGALFTHSSNGTVHSKIYSPANTTDLYIGHPYFAANALRFSFTNSANAFFQHIGIAELLGNKSITNGVGASTLDVSNCSHITLGNLVATNYTAITGGKPFQRIIIRCGNGQTTLTNNASIVTATGADRILTANSCLEFILNSAGTAMTEVGKL